MSTHYSITQETRRERNYKPVWVCRTGNIETMSSVSAYKAMSMHKKKLSEINKINVQETNVERFSFSY